MTRGDDAILEFLLNEGNRELISTPAVIAANIDFTAGYTRQRMSILLDAGLVEYHDKDKGMYQITEKGRKYLAGDLDADDLPEPDGDKV